MQKYGTKRELERGKKKMGVPEKKGEKGDEGHKKVKESVGRAI